MRFFCRLGFDEVWWLWSASFMMGGHKESSCGGHRNDGIAEK